MNTPVSADNKPIPIELKGGEQYDYCTCGNSANQPFCDGSHTGSGFAPLPFVAEADETRYLCQCKHTGNPPFCDGSHQQVPDDRVGKASASAPRPAPEGPTIE